MKTLDNKDCEVLEKVAHDYQVILYDDPVNTFEHVMECLIKYCKHELHQAEQCTLIAHQTGKCSVKKGTYLKLEPVCSALLEKGLTAEIQ
jgi:ATP-dependent Clp protease adaptor protein ClpS